MSRRKQSNPKPLKLSTDTPSLKTEDGGQTDVSGDGETSTENNSTNHAMDDSQGETTSPASRSTPPGTPDAHKGEGQREIKSAEENTGPDMADTNTLQIKKEINTDLPSPTTLNSLASQLQLPQDVLYLKRVEITMHGNTAVCWVVCCDIPLPKGSSLGPFQGEITSAEKVRVGDLILQFSGKNNPVLVNVTGQSGAWLALLRTATSNAVKNTCVHLEGDRIWCEVVSDLEKGSELIGSFLYHLENESPPSSPVPGPAPLPPPSQEEDLPKSEPPPSSSSNKRSPTNHAALIFGCPFCSVRFSSPRTLQGHLAYYCSKKPPDVAEKLDEDRDADKSNMESADTVEESAPVVKSETMDEEDRTKGTKRHLEMSSESYQRDDDSPPAKTMKMGQTFKCSHCSYTADKLSSLNRHRRIHNRPSEDSEDSGHIPVPLSETYCKDCNIQFSSLSTFKGHKEFYCNKRKPTDSRSSDTPKKESWEDRMHGESSSSQSSPNSQQDEHPRNIYLPAGSLMSHSMITGVSSATVIPGQTAVIFAAPVMAPSEMGITMPTVIVQPVIASPASASASVSKDSPMSLLSKVPALAHQKSSSSSKSAVTCAEKPLDLSKKTADSPDKEKSPEKTLHFSKDSLKINLSRPFLKDIPPLKKIEPKSPPMVSPKINSSPQENSKSPIHTSRSMSPQSLSPSGPSRPKSPDHIRHRTSPFLQGLTHPFLSLAVSGMAAPSPVQPPASVASISKCADCNIVFYKHENYMIHKEHYCSGKKSKYSSTSKSECLKSPSSSPDASSPPQTETATTAAEDHDDKDTSEPKPDVSEEVYYRFFCVPCKIKFSSASTLNAHKEFYCPHGKDSGHSVVIQAGNVQEDEGPAKTPTPDLVDFRCDRCDSVFTTSRLLKLHLCSGESTSMPLFRCPHCDYVTQTDTRLSDHMKVHAPTRAFRCSICGYRGNTVRGMRMHGKMHIDNGEEFTDESMIEYEEPALMPIQTNGQLPHGPVDMEAELIRLKNEPYKRRRSRKSFEKSEYILSPTSLPQTQHCPVCRDTFPNLKFLNVHMRIHEITLKYQQDLLKCPRCSYSATSKENLAFHVKDSHTTPQSSPSPVSPKKSPSLDHRPPSQAEDRVIIKQEPVDNYYPNCVGSVNHKNLSPSSPDKENIVKTENIQDRSYTPKSDTSPGVRASPYSRVSPNSHLSPLNTPASPPIKLQPRSPEDGAVNSSGKDKHSPDLARKDIANGSGSHSIIFPTGPMFPYFLIPPTNVGNTVVPPEPTSPKIEKGPKYCKNCDISFTYLATFLAHKKYYCTAAKTTEELSPSASA